jgi:hypothetical protein
MSLALLVTNAAEEKSATSYALRTSLQSSQKLSYSLDSACPPPELSIPHSYTSSSSSTSHSRLAFEASPSRYAVLAPPPPPILVGSILPHHGQPPFPKYLTTFIT